jgi:opacity protein-like surface antigen
LVGGTVSSVQSLVSVLNTNSTAFAGQQTSALIGAPGNPAPGQQGGGVWARGVSGSIDTNTTGSYRFSPFLTLPGGTGRCQTETSQDYAGVQVGADISRLNINGANVHFGVTTGYTESSTRSPIGRRSGVLRSDFQVPSVGVYGAVTKGGFFADAQLRWDFFQSQLDSPATGVFNQASDARSFSITSNVGYQAQLPDNWFIEPSAGIVYARASVDPINFGGTLLLATTPGIDLPATARVNDFDSILGRASVRVGRNFQTETMVLQPFATASVFNEFADPVTTQINTNLALILNLPGVRDARGTLTSNRIGTYGQFSLGLAGQVLNTGWLGYVRGDYRTGEQVEGYAISGGLRYQFNPDQVPVGSPGIVRKGADAPVFAVAQAPFNWTGFSIGGSIGALSDHSEQRLSVGNIAVAGRPNAAGIMAGGQVGFDYQLGSVVVGVAGDLHWSNAEGGRSCSSRLIVVDRLYNCESSVDPIGMATGRVGYALDRTLFYVKGGAAFAETSERFRPVTGSAALRQLPPVFAAGPLLTFTTREDWSAGWTLGAGVEFALNANWSAKAEYMHYELEQETRRFTNRRAAAPFAGSSQHSGDLVKVGVNYRFNLFETAAPVVAAAPAARPVVTK